MPKLNHEKETPKFFKLSDYYESLNDLKPTKQSSTIEARRMCFKSGSNKSSQVH